MTGHIVAAAIRLARQADQLADQARRRPPGHPHDEAYALAEIAAAAERITAASHLLATPPVPTQALIDRSRTR